MKTSRRWSSLEGNWIEDMDDRNLNGVMEEPWIKLCYFMRFVFNCFLSKEDSKGNLQISINQPGNLSRVRWG